MLKFFNTAFTLLSAAGIWGIGIMIYVVFPFKSSLI